MPIYMDVHIIPGVKAQDVAEAHQKDISLAQEYKCKCMTYWVDEKRENVFCLIEAPEKNVVEALHRQAHGLIPHKIIEVSSVLVESFLGRTEDPADAQVTKDGLKVFHEPSLRFLLVTKIEDPVLLKYKLGDKKAAEILRTHDLIIRENLAAYAGREAGYNTNNFIASFSSAVKVLACALSVQKDMIAADMCNVDFRIGINAGEPVTENDKLFGDTIQLAKRICSLAKQNQIAVASHVKELVSANHFENDGRNTITLLPADEALLNSLYNTLEDCYADPELNVADYCQKMAMSKSQLYRKTVAVFGLSPNLLLKDFRLEKALELMKKQRYNISEITFETGFASPSYFTKCFKKKYGLLPVTYLDLLH
jgi:AraC-like DNA-binding protein